MVCDSLLTTSLLQVVEKLVIHMLAENCFNCSRYHPLLYFRYALTENEPVTFRWEFKKSEDDSYSYSKKKNFRYIKDRFVYVLPKFVSFLRKTGFLSIKSLTMA